MILYYISVYIYVTKHCNNSKMSEIHRFGLVTDCQSAISAGFSSHLNELNPL